MGHQTLRTRSFIYSLNHSLVRFNLQPVSYSILSIYRTYKWGGVGGYTETLTIWSEVGSTSVEFRKGKHNRAKFL